MELVGAMEADMKQESQDRNVFKPRELLILKSALRRASRRLEENYGLAGPKLEAAQLVAAAAIFETAKGGEIKADHLAAAGAESVRVFLKWACAA